MSNHTAQDTHHTTHTEESKGIWILPLLAVIFALLAVWFFTRDAPEVKPDPLQHATEMPH